jgi:hypothetical protein
MRILRRTLPVRRLGSSPQNVSPAPDLAFFHIDTYMRELGVPAEMHGEKQGYLAWRTCNPEGVHPRIPPRRFSGIPLIGQRR